VGAVTRDKFPGWTLDPDPLHIEPDPEPPRRFGCLSFAVLLLVLVAGVPAPQGAPHGFVKGVVGATPAPRAALPGASERATSRSVVADAPTPTGAASSIYSASATWCAPTATQCQGWGGKATLAAVHSFRYGDRPYWVEVEYRGKVSPVLVVSHCACHDSHGYIDLSPYAFEKLAPLSRGRIDVTVRTLDEAPDQSGDDGPANEADDRMRLEDRELPATDTAP
jgi:hypothetical protein